VLGPTLIARYGLRVITAGGAIAAVGLLILIAELQALGGNVTAQWLLIPTALVGLGNGLILPALVGAVLVAVPPDEAGAASGVLTTTQQFSGASGVAVLGALFFALLGTNPAPADYAAATELIAIVDCVLVLTAAALTYLMPRPAAAPDVLHGPARDTATVVPQGERPTITPG
jgi:MFS family permease